MSRAWKLLVMPGGVEVRVTSRPLCRGVFATRPYKAGEAIEAAPVLVVRQAVLRVPKGLRNHYLSWPGGYAVGLGYLSLYNHSYDPDAVVEVDERVMLAVVRALRKIRKGEEVRINYAGPPGARESVGFKVLR